MAEVDTKGYRDAIRRQSHALSPNETGGYDALLDAIGSARLVLLGEASHGTHEFYSERADITKRLILEKGYSAVAVEADFPDAYRVNRYIRGESEDEDAVEALAGFKRFPAWMWRTPTSSISSAGSANTTTSFPRSCKRWGFTDSISTA